MAADDSPPAVEPDLVPPLEPVTPRGSWRRTLGFALLNAWLGYHLFAVIICPASVAPAAPIVQAGWTLAAGYLQALYLNHGFHFFAPEPAGSTLIRYTLEFPDGSTRSGQVPDRGSQPRLRYHRHFMVTEYLGNGPDELRPLVERSIARHLCHSTGAARVTLKLVYHNTAGVNEILAGQTLNEPALFTEIELGSYTPAELAAPYQPPTLAPEVTEELAGDPVAEEPVPLPPTTQQRP